MNKCVNGMQVLGRAASVGAFDKRGEESGHVKISLSGNTPEHIIRITRKIDTKNKSEWLLDGTPLDTACVFLHSSELYMLLLKKLKKTVEVHH